MSRITDINSQRLKNSAIEFVNIWITSGAEAAAYWAKDNIPEEDFDESSKYIREEFVSRGYEFRPWPNRNE